MFGRKEVVDVEVLKHLNTSSVHWCNEAALISVANGLGSLTVRRKTIPDNYYGSIYHSTLELNNTPLVQARLPGCPTCAGMLATGYGIENCDSVELKNISEHMNSDYVDITASIETLTPVLSLLSSGLYVIADSVMYPTDGNGHFFWDVPNQLSEYSVTAVVLTENYDYIGGFPSYLYPSQSSERFDEQRVQYYMKRFSLSKNWPRAVSYQFGEFVSILLDGHHKVTAAALMGEEARCINIIPMTAMSYKPEDRTMKTIDEIYFSGIKISAKEIPPSILKSIKKTFGKCSDDKDLKYKPIDLVTKRWERKYRDTIKYYPDLTELAESIVLGIDNVTDELIAECFSDQCEKNLRKLRFIISYLSRKRDERIKKLSLKCGRLNAEPKLTEMAFKTLAKIKDDGDIESFFINYLIDHNDKHDILKKIADSYWE